MDCSNGAWLTQCWRKDLVVGRWMDRMVALMMG